MRTSLLLASVALAELCVAEHGTFSMQTYKNVKKHQAALRSQRKLRKRDGPFNVDLGGMNLGGGFYYVNASVGTPGQQILLDVDTGSADVWMFGAHSCDSTTSPCIGGAFDDTSSSTYELINQGGFQIQYFTQGSGVEGDYITDDYSVGGVTVKNLIMGLARQAESVPTGIMGIGFALDESLVSQVGDAYPNFPDRLKKDGIIQTNAYSLYLNDQDAESGTLLFGGYDEAKFDGELGILEIQPSIDSGSYSDMAVILSTIGVTDSKGSTVISSQNTPNSVILDSGTAFTILPSDIFTELVNYFGAVSVQDGAAYAVDCDLGGQTGTLDFQFGSTTGPLISVPFHELAVPLLDDNGKQIIDKDGKTVCELGISEPTQDGEPYLFGDTFLRSAYVVYDLDNLQIGIAQTKFNTSDSSIKAITANSKGSNLPGNVASQATTISQTETQGVDGGAATAANATFTSQSLTVATASTAEDGAISGVKTTYTNRATNVPGGSPSKGQAPSYRAAPAGTWVKVMAHAGGVLAVVSIGAIVLL